MVMKAKLVGRRRVRALPGIEQEGIGAMVPCAFCRGKGRDPFLILSPLSSCPVCHGRGKVHVREPFESCGACQGSGRYFNSHMYCWPCRGKGVVPIKSPS